MSPGPFYSGHGNSGNAAQIPVLTTFIPSLPQNSPFRVSVHSWDRPRPSRRLEGFMQPEDVVLYEVRVFIDGLCVSYGWPIQGCGHRWIGEAD